MKNSKSFFILALTFLAGCDPASISARVKPNKNSEVQDLNYGKNIKADIYLSDDKKS